MYRRRQDFQGHPSLTLHQTENNGNGRSSVWHWVLLHGFFLAIIALSTLRGGPIQAQESPTEPADQHQIFLPAVVRTTSQALPVSSHGEWPAGRSYTVRAGDTLLSVALEIGVDLEEINCLFSPTFSWRQPLVIGDTVTIPDTPFLCHVVEPGQTLANIAGIYGVRVEAILAEPWNDLKGEPVPGQNLRILLGAPAAPKPLQPLVNQWTTQQVNTPQPGPLPAPENPDVPADWPYGTGAFAWPTYGWITQGYRVGHSAIDIAAPLGTPVTAADRGVVIRAGWSNAGYGQFVIIDHNIDYITLYAHLSAIFVQEGDVVAKGQLLGHVGSTGNSTGPHLHFEIRDFGRRVDPLSLLPR
jgi:LysM repeat protein